MVVVVVVLAVVIVAVINWNNLFICMLCRGICSIGSGDTLTK